MINIFGVVKLLVELVVQVKVIIINLAILVHYRVDRRPFTTITSARTPSMIIVISSSLYP